MKQLIRFMLLLVCLLGTGLNSMSQSTAERGFNYQAVVRDNSGNLLPNAGVNFRFSLEFNNAYGGVVTTYKETHTGTTNALGLVNLVVGTGTPVYPYAVGDFENYTPWDNPTLSLRVEVDPTGSGTSYSLMSNALFRAVPYAYFAKQSQLSYFSNNSDEAQHAFTADDALYSVQSTYADSAGYAAFSGNASTASVALSANIANHANTADQALVANSATFANSANTANSSNTANSASTAGYATNAGHASTATTATQASGLVNPFTNYTVFSNTSNSFTGSFNGNGSGLTNLSASQITTGTLSASNGGTGVLPSLTSPGSILFSYGGNWNVLPPGAEGKVLKIVGGMPTWSDESTKGTLTYSTDASGFTLTPSNSSSFISPICTLTITSILQRVIVIASATIGTNSLTAEGQFLADGLSMQLVIKNTSTGVESSFVDQSNLYVTTNEKKEFTFPVERGPYSFSTGTYIVGIKAQQSPGSFGIFNNNGQSTVTLMVFD